MGLTLSVASPFPILGAIEASEALLPDSSEALSNKTSEETKNVEKLNSGGQRPVSAWKFWVNGHSNSLSSAELQNSSSHKPATVLKKAKGEKKEGNDDKKT